MATNKATRQAMGKAAHRNGDGHNQPDFWVKARKRDDDISLRVGAGWINEDGSISARLDPFVVLPGGKENQIILFPVD